MKSDLPMMPIGEVRYRERARVRGRVRSVRITPFGDTSTLEAVVADDTGGILVVFYGRPKIGGIDLGRRIEIQGMAGLHRTYLAVINPEYTLLPAA